ncbi:hypothetical protein [Micromonospora craniellae]|nr:hypothetical protein [Micromonospora craniellae]
MPDADASAYRARTLSTGPYPVRTTVTMHAPAAMVAERIWPG